MYIKIICCNIDGTCNKTLISVYENGKKVIEKYINYCSYIYLPKNKVYSLIVSNHKYKINTVFITDNKLKKIVLVFNKVSSLVTLKVIDKYYKEAIIEKGMISLWQNMM